MATVADTTTATHTVDAPLSKDDYLAATTGPQPGYTATIDGVDSNVGATVQSDARQDYKGGATALVVNDLPGAVYAPHQLPNPQAAIAAGLPPVTIPEHLIVEDADNHPSGPDLLDRESLALRKSLGDPFLNTSGIVETSSGDLVVGPGVPEAAPAPVVAEKHKAPKEPVIPVV